jgi:methylated-DNA-protein-cysteine methyltransferase-like protein
MSNFYDAVYVLVRDIPCGKVMTYGQIATILGAPRAARAVGYALKACGSADDPVPWQRVINHKGGISARGETARPCEQLTLLEAEGVEFGADATCDLKVYRWDPPDPERYAFALSKDLPFL